MLRSRVRFKKLPIRERLDCSRSRVRQCTSSYNAEVSR